MKNSKQAWIVFSRIMIVLFVIFLISYFQVESGVYDSKVNERTILTEEKIKEFEEDVRNGEFIDIKNYTEEELLDTSNKISNLGFFIGEGIDDFINEKVVNVFKFIGNLFK